VARQSQQTQALGMESLSLIQALPPDLPPEWTEEVAALTDRYAETARQQYGDPAVAAIDGVFQQWSQGAESLGQQFGAC